jgi:dTDP-4-dehydrorhamnose 3,5-epimerase
MINSVEIKKIQKYSDDRGWVAEIFREDEVDFRSAMTYMSFTNPGVVRGPHEHVSQSDYFIFAGCGNFELHLWDNRKDSLTFGEYEKMEVGEVNPVSVLVPPGVVHGYKCIGNTVALSINLPDKLYRGQNKSEEVDEVRWEQKEDSPFKIN